MTEQEMLQNFLNKLDNVKQTGSSQYTARCPSHDDQVESLSVSLGQNKINFWCHAGCSGDEILNAINLSWNDIYFNDNQKKKKRKIVATYDYNDKNGNLLFQVVRFKPKTFRQRRPDGQGGWNWGLGDIKPVLYKLPEVIKTVQNNKIVWLVEGEKDADNLMKLGFTATTAPMGAGKWRDQYTETLAGGKVIILPDNDKAGKKYAESVARELHGQTKIKILELPGLNKKGDVSDWLDNGGTKKELLKLVKDCPRWDPDINNWPDPLPFNNFDVKPLPADILPNWLRDFSMNIAEFTQTPIDMTIMLIFSALGAALSNKGVIQIRKGYTEPLNIWTCTVLPAGNRKSPVFKKVMGPILDYEERLREEMEPERRHALKEKSILEDQLKQKEKQASNVNNSKKQKHLMQQVFDLDDEIQEMDIPALPRLVASDITTEKLAKMMEENHGRIAILSPEGDIFKLMAGRYSKSGTANFENFKKAWTGGEPIRDDRMGRKGTHVKNPALTQGITVQPIVLEDLKDKKTFKGEGILGRFLYAIPESPVGRRKIGAEIQDLSEIAVMRYKKGLHVLLNTKPAGEKDNGEWEPHNIKLTPEALKIRDNFARLIESKLGEGGELNSIPDWGSKLVGNITRVAGLLHIAAQVNAKKGQIAQDIWEKNITPETMQRAVKLGKALIPHAKKIYDLLDSDPEIELAKYVLRRINKGKEMEKTGELKEKERFGDNKEIFDKAILYKLTRDKKQINKPADLDFPLQLLEELNYIKVVEQSNNGPGRPPSPKIKLNPKVSPQNPQNPQKNNKMGLMGKMGQDKEINLDNISRVSF